MHGFAVKISPLIALLLCFALSFALYSQHTELNAEGLKETWRGTYAGGQKVGYSHSVSTQEGDRYETSEESLLSVTTLGVQQVIEVRSQYTLEDLYIKAFTFSFKSGQSFMEARGVRSENKMTISVNSPSGQSSVSIAMDDDTLVFPTVYRWLMRQDPEIGGRYNIKVFDPALILTGNTIGQSHASITVLGRETISTEMGSFDTIKVEMNFSGFKTTAWVDSAGDIVKESSELGLVSLIESREKALGAKLSSYDITEKTAISSNVTLNNARKLKYLRATLKGIEDSTGLALNNGARQTFSEGIIEVKMKKLNSIEPYEIPNTDMDKRPHIKPSLLIQSADPQIKNLAQEILDGETNSVRSTEKMVKWVYRNLEKEPTVSIPNALDVLKTRKGDCNEHAVLLAALLRASGIPAKVALGVVYLNGKFYYHAWNEVYIGEWVAVDSTFGQMPADASHIKLLRGGLEKSSEISRFIGKLELEIQHAK